MEGFTSSVVANAENCVGGGGKGSGGRMGREDDVDAEEEEEEGVGSAGKDTDADVDVGKDTGLVRLVNEARVGGEGPGLIDDDEEDACTSVMPMPMDRQRCGGGQDVGNIQEQEEPRKEEDRCRSRRGTNREIQERWEVG